MFVKSENTAWGAITWNASEIPEARSQAPRGATSQHPNISHRPLRSHYGNHSDAEVVCSGEAREAVIGPILSIALSV